MKTRMMMGFLSILISAGTAAADCAADAAEAAAKVEAGKNEERLAFLDAKATLVKATGKGTSKNLIYDVEILEQYADNGATYEFPETYYRVTATGDEATCKITSVRIRKKP